MRKLLYLILIAFFLSSCEKKVEWQLQTVNTNLIVVDGIITNEPKTHTIIINYPVTQINEKPEPVTGATVLISDGDSTYTLTEQPVNTGRYNTNNNFSGQINKTYSLLINYNNKVYTAKTYMVRGLEINPGNIYLKNPNNNLYHLCWVAPPFNTPKPAMWEVIIDWSMLPEYNNFNPDSCKSRLLFYTLPTLDVSQIFAPEIEKVFFPKGSVINLRRYSLNKEHAEFIRSLLLETNWQGGVFSSVPANVLTNLSNGAMGYFGACEVVSVSQTVQ